MKIGNDAQGWTEGDKVSNAPLSETAVDRTQRYQITIRGSWNSFSKPFPGFEWRESARLMNEKEFNPG